MFFQGLVRFIQQLFEGEEPTAPAPPKTYTQRYEETSQMSTGAISTMIWNREEEEKPSGVAHRVLADRSDERAARLHMDPPRPGRKTYQGRLWETRQMSPEQIRALIIKREGQGQETGILHRVLSELDQD